jgi:hypothetical protein
MTKDLTAVRWVVLVALMLFAIAVAGGAVSGMYGFSGTGSGPVLLADDPDAGGQ